MIQKAIRGLCSVLGILITDQHRVLQASGKGTMKNALVNTDLGN